MGRIVPATKTLPSLTSTRTQFTQDMIYLSLLSEFPSLTFESNGNFWELPDGSSGDIEIRNSSNSILYTCTSTNINSATSRTMSDYTGSFHLSSADSALYFMVEESSNVNFSLLKFTEGGTLTLIGNFVLTNAVSSNSNHMPKMERVGNNFECLLDGWQFTVSAIDATVVAQNTRVLTNFTTARGTSYQTEDGTYSIRYINNNYANESYLHGLINHNSEKHYGFLGIKLQNITYPSYLAGFALWDDYVITGKTLIGSVPNRGDRIIYNRSDVDNWIKGVAEYYGI